MAYCKAKLKSNGDKASPCFKPFFIEEISDKCLPTWAHAFSVLICCSHFKVNERFMMLMLKRNSIILYLLLCSYSVLMFYLCNLIHSAYLLTRMRVVFLWGTETSRNLIIFSPHSGLLNPSHKILIKHLKMCQIVHVKHKSNLAGITTNLLKLCLYETTAVCTFEPKIPVLVATNMSSHFLMLILLLS